MKPRPSLAINGQSMTARAGETFFSGIAILRDLSFCKESLTQDLVRNPNKTQWGRDWEMAQRIKHLSHKSVP